MYRSRCRSDSSSNSLRMLCCTCPCRSPQKLSFKSSKKCWKCSVIGVTFAMGVSLLLRMAFACKAKANLHPLAFTQPNLRHLKQFSVVSQFEMRLRHYRVSTQLVEVFQGVFSLR